MRPTLVQTATGTRERCTTCSCRGQRHLRSSSERKPPLLLARPRLEHRTKSLQRGRMLPRAIDQLLIVPPEARIKGHVGIKQLRLEEERQDRQSRPDGPPSARFRELPDHIRPSALQRHRRDRQPLTGSARRRGRPRPGRWWRWRLRPHQHLPLDQHNQRLDKQVTGRRPQRPTEHLRALDAGYAIPFLDPPNKVGVHVHSPSKLLQRHTTRPPQRLYTGPKVPIPRR